MSNSKEREKAFIQIIAQVKTIICRLSMKSESFLGKGNLADPSAYNMDLLLEGVKEQSRYPTEDQGTLNRFLATLSLMGYEDRSIIINKYVFDDGKEHWEYLYEKSTYYRKRTKAINAFLDIYYGYGADFY